MEGPVTSIAAFMIQPSRSETDWHDNACCTSAPFEERFPSTVSLNHRLNFPPITHGVPYVELLPQADYGARSPYG